MPFQPLARNPGLIGKSPNDALYRTRQRRTLIGNPEAHGIAQPDFHRHGCLACQLHQFCRKGQAEAIDIGAGDILKMAARHDAPFQSLLHDSQIVAQRLFAALSQLEVDMIVGHAGQHAHFIKLHVPGDSEIINIRTDPAGHARKAVPPRAAYLDGPPVLGGVHEKFRGLDKPALASEFMQQIKDAGNLPHRVGRTGLLSVPEGGIGDEARIRRTRHDDVVIELDTADFRIGEYTPEQLGRFRVFKMQGTQGIFLVKQAHGVPRNSRRAVRFVPEFRSASAGRPEQAFSRKSDASIWYNVFRAETKERSFHCAGDGRHAALPGTPPGAWQGEHGTAEREPCIFRH